MINIDQQFTALEQRIRATWGEILDNSSLAQSIRTGEFSKELYMIYMLETYHYTSHNARNQALAGVAHPENPVYMKFCFDHAADEAGHEMMALHDLRSLGNANDELQLPAPLPSTETLIAYLYWASKHGNPFRRLGYSFWAESSYDYINPLIGKVKEQLGLKDSQLTFFVAHSAIDEEHAREVRNVIERVAKTASDWDAIGETAEISLRLTGRMLDEVYAEYVKLASGQPSRYSAVRDALFSSR
ncbi:iron-containing redox enzyme family protein [Burkholderia stagnalis]|uniref:iron-containing redox enzyme family protein n=1 Tax=Burkholderia stagnalis TaxID=1503054 RepID=UPI0007584203|nr:iron-containing redox enzyme family protein [Burkholderia stagnalis]AOK54677.1 TenA family transcriptional regulator [Burkholderia stagnalis]KVC62176.1 TenA family transcriptional regulator [Burkholderia stagnalis]KVN16434.1 TenA family transcriptional regulator [Burkholderia stagnalis]KVN78584.1 TenA family transcriptional regulator [Burkholderia stagnalis]KVO50468.1 TenA family transcriptional regulator [Burkholderia stagnalis]